jgi:hypothetical protein
MKREIQKSLDFNFSWYFSRDNITITPASSLVEFFNSSGTVIQASAAGTIAADGKVSKTLTAANIGTVERNYKVKITYTYNSETFIFYEIFDVVECPLVNNVRDEDLFVYIKELRDKVFTFSGKTTAAGNVGGNTFIDEALKKPVDNFIGARAELYLTESDVRKLEIQSIDKTTGTATFLPALGSAVPLAARYVMRGNYSAQIKAAWEDFAIIAARDLTGIAAAFVDSNVFKNLTIFKALEIISGSYAEIAEDKWTAREKKFSDLYNKELTRLSSEMVDEDGDGSISASETTAGAGFSTCGVIA